MAEIKSKIIGTRSEKGISGLYVEAWEQDKQYHDPLGTAITGEMGHFQISFEDADLSDESGDQRPFVFFRVYHEHQLIKSTEREPVPIAAGAEIPPITVDINTNDMGSAHTFRISGRVVQPTGRGIPGLIIYAFHKTAREEIWLSGGKTDLNGAFLVYYQSEQLIPYDRDSADLIIKAYRTIRDESPLITSPLIINALYHEVINLVVGDDPYSGLDLYTQIHEKLSDSLQVTPLSEIQTRELYLLANSKDLDLQFLFWYIQARRWTEQSDVLAPEIFFGWFKTGLPTRWAELVSRPVAELLAAIDTAVEDGFIPKSSLRYKNDLESNIVEWRMENIISSSGQLLHRGSLGQLFKATSLSDKESKELIQSWQTFVGEPDEFWQEQREKLGEGKFQELELTLQLGSVTRNHLPLIAKLKEQSAINHIHDLATLEVEDWLQILDSDEIEIPADIAGDDLSERRKEFAQKLRLTTEYMLPTAVLAKSLERDEEIQSKSFDRFFAQNQEFDFRAQPVRSYILEHPDALSGIADEKAFSQELEAMQRIFHLTPAQNKYQAVKILWQNLLHSAFAIKISGEETLYELFKTEPETAYKIYQNASNKQNLSQAVRMQLQDMASASTYVTPQWKGTLPNIEGVGDLETLFGDEGYCECRHCQSFFSPAAYLVDLFLYLNKAKVDAANPAPDQDTVLERLYKRRPDLGNIQLDCENSHTPLPYIDLVNEVLEDAVSPLVYQLKTVQMFGKTFTIPIADTPQTEGNASTLKAYPQHLNPNAYEILQFGDNAQGIAYPWNLPFNLWIEEARIYLEHLGAPRWKLMDSILGGGTDNHTISDEYLGLIPEDKVILIDTSSDATSLSAYWGVSPAQLENVPVFMKQSGFSYSDLQQLIQLRFIQSANPNAALAVQFDPASSCKVSDASLQNLTETVLSRIHRFGRLLQVTGYSMKDLDRVLLAFGNEIDVSFLHNLAQISQLEKMLPRKIERNEMLSWWQLLDTHDYPDEPSAYRALFLNTTINQPVAVQFELNPTGDELQNAGTVIVLQDPNLDPDLLAIILGATRLKAKDLQMLAESELPGGVITLNLQQLSFICRVASFCRAFGLSVTEYLSLKNIFPVLPLATPDLNPPVTPGDTLEFIKMIQTTQRVGFSPEILDYLLRHQYPPKASFTSSEEERETLLKELQGQINQQSNEAYPAGITSKEKVETKLMQVLENTHLDVAKQIISGESELAVQEQKDFMNDHLVFFPNAEEAITQLVDGGLTDTESRYLYTLQALHAYLLENIAIQHLAHAMSADVQIMALLLKEYLPHPFDQNLNALHVFLEEIFTQADPTDNWTSLEMPGTFFVTGQLHKLILVITTLKLTAESLSFLMKKGTAAGLPDLRQLPLVGQSSVPVGLTEQYIALCNLILLNKEIFKGEHSVFILLDDAQNVNSTKETLLSTLSNESGWDLDDLQYLTGTSAMNLDFPTDYQNGEWLEKLAGALRLVTRVGATARQMTDWSSVNITKVQADSVRHAVKAKYSEEQWLEVTKPLRDKLRERQRNALLKFVLHHRKKHNQQSFDDINDIFGYYLMDTQMAACSVTSRIVLAASSVQLFVQRILMNLEPGISFSHNFAREWKWRKYYRVWEANRKVLVWPENWIEPELRDDKTPFFQELENELLQDALTGETVERAYVNYLHKLDNTARLEICGLCEDDQKTLHVFGRTHSAPAFFYYRRWIHKREWTAWEKVELDIYNSEGVDPIPSRSILLPFVHNGRLYLFWPVFTLKHVGPTEDDKKSIKFLEIAIDNIKSGVLNGGPGEIRELEGIIAKMEEGHNFYETRMAWSYYYNGGWQAKKITGAIPTPHLDKMFDRIDAYLFIAKITASNDLRIRWYYIHSKTVYKFKSYFPFDSCKGFLTTHYEKGYNNVGKLDKKMWFMKYLGKASETLDIKNKADKEINLLYNVPWNYQLAFSSQKGIARMELPFFYEDPKHTFFIVPPSPRISMIPQEYMPTSMLTGGTNLVQESVYTALSDSPGDLEMAVDNGSLTQVSGRSTLQDHYFGAGDTGQVVYRNSKTDDPDTITSTELSFEFTNVMEGIVGVQAEKSRYESIKLIQGDYLIQTFYHPLTCLMLKHLSRYGVEGLLSPDPKNTEGKELNYQLTPDHLDSLDFKKEYHPNHSEIKWTQAPRDIIDFDFDEAYACYNWELFYHIPLFIATRLSQDQRFEEAQGWFHFIFDPTESVGDVPYRFWKVKPFHTYTTAQIKKDIDALIKGDSKLKKQIQAWEQDPFNPHLIARFRRLAYMKAVIMKYLDNLIAWGDQLFRRDNIESINEATQLYILAGQVLGKMPVETEAKEKEAKSFNNLAPDITQLGNAWVQLEMYLQQGGDEAQESSDQNGGVLDDILYFCMPPNEKLLSYWDTVADRLFKIRNCMNIEGQVRELALFQPPIDPALLVKAAAAGIDLSSALNDLFAPLPHYRFTIMIQKAQEICQELKSLGNGLLAALEKKDAEGIASIRVNQEVEILKANQEIRSQRVKEAQLAEEVLQEAKALATIRKENYEDRNFINPAEIAAFALARSASITQGVGAGLQAGAGAAHQGPDAYTGGLAGPMGGAIALVRVTGGDKVGKGIEAAGKWLDFASIILRDLADASATLASYERRQEDWDLQIDLAEQELKQIDKQLLENQIRIAIAEKERVTNDLQLDHARLVADRMKNKYTNEQLYSWMIGQISSVYFQSYQLAYDIAKQAEKTFRFELGIENSNFIQFGYWDNMRKGLIAGEKLHQDLKRLEMAYFEKNKREYEISRHVSISFINPAALLKLKEKGECEFDIPELLFDLDYPGHYFRRIKSVSITIPCIVGPYTGVSAKLTLIKNRIRKSGNSQTAYAYSGIDDPKFIHNLLGMQSIVTSSGQEDSGMFELNFRDERYLPFEGAGAISSWKIQLPDEFRSFDYNTISDVVLHMNYTSRDGGDAFKEKVQIHAKDTINKWLDEMAESETGLLRLISMKQEFSTEWFRFFRPQTNDQSVMHNLPFELRSQHFPYFLRDRTLSLISVELALKLKSDEAKESALGLPLEFFHGKDESITAIEPETNNGLQEGIANLPMISFTPSESPVGWWSVQLKNSDVPNDLKVENNEDTPLSLDSQKIEDMYLILRYSV